VIKSLAISSSRLGFARVSQMLSISVRPFDDGVRDWTNARHLKLS